MRVLTTTIVYKAPSGTPCVTITVTDIPNRPFQGDTVSLEGQSFFQRNLLAVTPLGEGESYFYRLQVEQFPHHDLLKPGDELELRHTLIREVASGEREDGTHFSFKIPFGFPNIYAKKDYAPNTKLSLGYLTKDGVVFVFSYNHLSKPKEEYIQLVSVSLEEMSQMGWLKELHKKFDAKLDGDRSMRDVEEVTTEAFRSSGFKIYTLKSATGRVLRH